MIMLRLWQQYDFLKINGYKMCTALPEERPIKIEMLYISPFLHPFVAEPKQTELVHRSTCPRGLLDLKKVVHVQAV